MLVLSGIDRRTIGVVRRTIVIMTVEEREDEMTTRKMGRTRAPTDAEVIRDSAALVQLVGGVIRRLERGEIGVITAASEIRELARERVYEDAGSGGCKGTEA